MAHTRDVERCREDAHYFRTRATAVTDDRLRGSYLDLAAEYERLAEVLVRIRALD